MPPTTFLPIFVAVLLQFSLLWTDFLHVFSLLDRVVDDLNPMLNFTRKEVENLLHFVEKEPAPQASLNIKGIKEPVLQLACLKYPHLITKVRPWFACVPVLHSPLREACLASLFPSSKVLFHTDNLNLAASFPCRRQSPSPLQTTYPILVSS